MGTETVGLRRLYDALGCTVDELNEVVFTFALPQNRLGKIYIGSTPPFGIRSIEADPYVVPDQKNNMMSSGAEYQSNCFLEISIAFEVHVEDSLSEGLSGMNQKANIEILDMVEPFEEELSKWIDLVAGLIGLKFHKQFVLKQLIEDSFISSGPEPVFRFAGPWIENLESIIWTESGSIALKSYANTLGSVTTGSIVNPAKVMRWLLKAWREQDPVAKFMYLFIPLECLLETGGSIDPKMLQHIESIQDIVSTSGREDSDVLVKFLKTLESKFAPTLNARFESLAQKYRISGWELDVAAFKKFNRTRNLLLHAGVGTADSHLELGEETRTLEDLVERYISLAIFGDNLVYISQWRPLRNTTA